jgi:tripartite-type tricarboxylate transporter receptor subunit TctC
MMGISRRDFLVGSSAAITLPVSLGAASAQDAYPKKPIRLFVGFAPGGSTDTVGRLIGQALTARLGQSIVVENRPGAGTNIATEAAIRSTPDGYTLLMVGPSVAINATLYKELNFNFMRDAEPVSSIASQAQVMLANPKLPVKNVGELIDYAKKNPGKLTVASAGIGSIGHLTGELFKMKAGVDLLHVPYRGAAPALADLVSGQVDVSFAGIAGAVEFASAGTLRALGVSTKTRSDRLPDVPVIADFLPGFESNDWFGMAAPKNTPPEIIALLNREIAAAVADPKLKARFADLGAASMPMSQSDFGRLLRDDTEKWGEVVRTAKITPI